MESKAYRMEFTVVRVIDANSSTSHQLRAAAEAREAYVILDGMSNFSTKKKNELKNNLSFSIKRIHRLKETIGLCLPIFLVSFELAHLFDCSK